MSCKSWILVQYEFRLFPCRLNKASTTKKSS